jgi:hypothetical protein
VSLLTELDALLLARELIARRARVSIVHLETGVSRGRLRQLYRELHGHSAPCGQLPAIGCAAIQTRRTQLHASLLARAYERIGGPSVYRTLDIRSVIAAHDVYRLLARRAAPEIDFTAAWVIARDLRVGASQLCRCPRCEVHYLVSENSRTAPTCPVCTVYARAFRARRADHGRGQARSPIRRRRPPRTRR